MQVDRVGRHGRLEPYAPTEQDDGRFASTRGNTPAGVTLKVYQLYFNRADSRFYKAAGGKKQGRDESRAAREDGRTRDLAIDLLIEDGNLAGDFVDDDS